MIELQNTTSGAVNKALAQARRNQGVASGLVFTLITVCEQGRVHEVRAASEMAGREHPSRTLMVVLAPDRPTGLDAIIHVEEQVPGDIVELTVGGELAAVPQSVLLPLILPDLPVVAWWPYDSPADPSADPIGMLAVRRITDASGAANPLEALVTRAQHHTGGDTDLVWTRLTSWRALLAAAVEQCGEPVTSATVGGETGSAPSSLLAAWLTARLGFAVPVEDTPGPGITEVRLGTASGDIVIARADGAMAHYTVPGQQPRLVALRRRPLNELLTEELRRMDRDDIFDQAMRQLAQVHQ